MLEPDITINGVMLSKAQAATVRVAVCNLLMQMSEPGALGGDAHGRAMSDAYKTTSAAIIRMINDGFGDRRGTAI